MPDDEPLDDARQVGTAAAAAAARVVETVAREARDQVAQHHALLQRRQDQEQAQQTLAGLRASYDSPEARTQRDTVREAAGVPAEAREVQKTADLMRGSNPALAASQGARAKAAAGEQGAKSVAVRPRREVQQAR